MAKLEWHDFGLKKASKNSIRHPCLKVIMSLNYVKRRDNLTPSRIDESHKNESRPYRFLIESISGNHLKHYFCCHNERFPLRCHWRYDTYKGYYT